MTKSEILTAAGIGEQFQDIYETTATLDEMREAMEDGAAGGGYFSVRISGYSHVDAMGAWLAGARLPGQMAQYAAARGEGASHEMTLAALQDGYLIAYSNALAAGATDQEIRLAHAAGVDDDGYANARIWGATHSEIMAVASEGLDVYAYSLEREGQDHTTAVSALRTEHK